MIHFLKNLVPQWIRNIYHWKMAVLACAWYGFPARKLKVIGVTGTDGKTTTANMITRVLEMAGKRTALASTINFRINGIEEVNKTKYTTLSPFFVQGFLRRAVREGCEYAILEVSSHSLDQNRLWGIYFSVAVLTNITREHLDYHKTMERYRRAKRKLFEYAETIVINGSVPNIEEFLNLVAKRKIVYSLSNQNVSPFVVPAPSAVIPAKAGIQDVAENGAIEHIFAENIETSITSSRFTVSGTQFEILLPGIFNVENALATIATGEAVNIDREICVKALGKIQGVSGRMEFVPNDRGVNILIDYAVTPNALKRVYELLARSKEDGKIIAVFGACGERDRGKRPIMGEIVDEYADVIILTNEDPYFEDPERILDEIERGISFRSVSPLARRGDVRLRTEGAGGKIKNETYFRIFDRRDAIAKALSIACKGDTVVITGKGAEETMLVRGKMIPWNDKKVVLELLQVETF